MSLFSKELPENGAGIPATQNMDLMFFPMMPNYEDEGLREHFLDIKTPAQPKPISNVFLAEAISPKGSLYDDIYGVGVNPVRLLNDFQDETMRRNYVENEADQLRRDQIKDKGASLALSQTIQSLNFKAENNTFIGKAIDNVAPSIEKARDAVVNTVGDVGAAAGKGLLSSLENLPLILIGGLALGIYLLKR